MKLYGKVAIITGAGSGIGRETAILFAKEGAMVVILDVSVDSGQETEDLIKANNGKAKFYRLDITNGNDVKLLIKTIISRYQRVDVLFNNAGISCVGPLHEIGQDEWRRVFEVNVNGVYNMSKEVVPIMINQRSGSIINMSSSVATMGVENRAAYSSTKGAILSMTKAMQVDYAPYNIRVNALMPGTVYTPFVEKYVTKSTNPVATLASIKKRQLTEKLGKPIDIAYAALYLASDESSFMLGSSFVIDGGLSNGKL